VGVSGGSARTGIYVCACREAACKNSLHEQTKPLPMVWDKLRRQKKKEMDTHYSKRKDRKQFRGHFHKTRKK